MEAFLACSKIKDFWHTSNFVAQCPKNPLSVDFYDLIKSLRGRMIKKILMTEKGKKFYVKDLSKDFHSQFGFVKGDDLRGVKEGGRVKTNLSKRLWVFSPGFIDMYQKIKRGPQIIPLKDIGMVIGEVGLGKKSKVLDAGGGSGGMACFLANICKSVVTYEIRKDFLKILNVNKRNLGLKNLKIKNKDIYNGIGEGELDLIMLDLPEPWKVVKHAEGALKVGGFLVAYCPTIPQVSDFVERVRESDLVYLKMKEIREREWEVEGRKVRPFSRMMGHSGFLIFCRSVRKFSPVITGD